MIWLYLFFVNPFFPTGFDMFVAGKSTYYEYWIILALCSEVIYFQVCFEHAGIFQVFQGRRCSQRTPREIDVDFSLFLEYVSLLFGTQKHWCPTMSFNAASKVRIAVKGFHEETGLRDCKTEHARSCALFCFVVRGADQPVDLSFLIS